MSKNNGKKKKKNTIQVRKLNPGDKFTLADNNEIKGVVLSISNMETNIYWYSIPDRWFKENYDEETMMDNDGNFYEGLDVYFYKKKTKISSLTNVVKLKGDE